MKSHFTHAECLGYAVFGIAMIISSLAWANGQEFFEPAHGKVDLAYVGRVRDINGRFLKGAEVVIWAPDVGLTFPAFTDGNGHYRSPDIGANIREVATTVDPKQLKVECALPGYEQVRPARIPNKAAGTVELNFTLRKVGSASAATSPAGSRSEDRPSHGWTWLVPTLLVIVVIGAAARR